MPVRTRLCRVLVLAVVAMPSPARAAAHVERVVGTPAFHAVTGAAVSKDGRYAAVAAFPTPPVVVAGVDGPNFSGTPVVGPQLAQPTEQVYLVDRKTRTSTLLSRSSTGDAGADKDAYDPSISADGRYVTFQSAATNVLPRAATVPAGTDAAYLYDRVTRKLTRVSLDWSGAEAGIDHDNGVTITPDGATILLRSSGKYLRAKDAGSGGTAVFARDRKTGRLSTVTRAKNGTVARAYNYVGVRTSRTGRYVAVASGALLAGTAGPESPGGNVYRFDMKTGTARLVRGAAADDTRCPQSLADANVCTYNVRAVAIDPEGTRVAYVVETTTFSVNVDTRLLVIDVASGRATPVATAASIGGLAFSADGGALYYVAPPAGADSATGEQVLYRVGLGTNATAATSPMPVLTSCRSEGCARLRIGSVAPVANGVAFVTDAPLTDDDTDGQTDAYVSSG